VILKKRGYRQHPGSGSGSIPFDGSDKGDLCEIKDARKSFTLSSSYIKRFWQTAMKQRKRPVMVVYFSDVDLTCEITFKKGRQ
jgi:hypothetical protein